MALAPIFKKAYWSLAIFIALYFGCLTILLNPWTQRQAIYLHRARLLWLQDPSTPEQLGFLKNQVQPFYINTPDGEKLYGWHVLPLALYAKHETDLLQQSGEPIDFSRTQHPESTLSFRLLMNDPDSRLIINFHGNAGTVAQGWRTDTYRSLSSGAGDKVHVLTVDYRGFGYSTGTPTEEGLIVDGVALAKWAVNELHIPSERIIFTGQSLGTAVATAVAEFLIVHEGIEIRNIILVAGFSDVPSLLRSYAIAGFIPVLSPLNVYPKLQSFYTQNVRDTWLTFKRLDILVRRCRQLNLQLIHAQNDPDIPWHHSQTLFYAAANATSERGMTKAQIDAVKGRQINGDGGFVSTWATRSKDGGKKSIRLDIVSFGDLTSLGHNRVATYPVVAKAVLNALTE